MGTAIRSYIRPIGVITSIVSMMWTALISARLGSIEANEVEVMAQGAVIDAVIFTESSRGSVIASAWLYSTGKWRTSCTANLSPFSLPQKTDTAREGDLPRNAFTDESSLN